MEGESMSHRRWKYDVFLSFRGEDTRKIFTAHLYKALKQRTIDTFIDSEDLERGKAIGELVTAIEESRFALVILSTNYATSSWCLDELVKILQCMKDMGQLVIPVFYQVDPSDVRHQRGSFQLRRVAQVEVKEHEDVYGENKDKLKEWAAALTQVANLSGFDSKNYGYVSLLPDS